jgi:sodium-dependent dicarboxylate transporter 2/3/5
MCKNIFKISIPFALFFIVLFLPPSAFNIPGLHVVEQRVIAVFILAAACWILEPIPIYATSVLVIVTELIMLSDKGLLLLIREKGTAEFGNLLSYQELMATFAAPVVMLFLGGFFLAMAATKYQMDLNLARVLLKPFGVRPKWMLLGIMCLTALFSMFMSNTATTAMMLAILTPVFAAFPQEDRGRIAFALSIPVAANIGGIGTPIGTPPNAIAMRYITAVHPISFGEWTMFAVPFVIVLLVLAWLLLLLFFPAETEAVDLKIGGRFRKGWQANVVYATFAVTVLLWMFGDVHGMNSYVVAMIPIAVFCCTGIITSKDLRTISWDVLWLIAGGIALGVSMEKTGLAKNIIRAIPFSDLAPFTVLLVAMSVTFAMANFMSHTATANLLLPVMAALATGLSLQGLESAGGAVGLILAVTFASSLGMTLPISTPPNALAYATGMVTTPDMAKVGLIIGLLGLGLTVVMLLCLRFVGFF